MAEPVVADASNKLLSLQELAKSTPLKSTTETES